MKQEVICSKCSQNVQRILSLECTHNLCLSCASKLLLKLHKTSHRLTNIECQICGVVSYLHPSAYEELISVQVARTKQSRTKESRLKESFSRGIRQPSQHNVSESLDPTVLLFCFTCQTPCFSVDQYILGQHRNHQVGSTTKPQTMLILKERLEEVGQHVRKRLETSLRQSTKLTQRKRQLIEQLGKVKTSIRSHFQKIRQGLILKQNQMLTELQNVMAKRFSIIDSAIQQLKIFSQKCQNYDDSIRCYYEAVLPIDSQKGFNFYANRKNDIMQEMAHPVEKITDKAIRQATNVTINNESLVEYADLLKKVKLVVKNDVERKESGGMEYFEAMRQQIFNQEPHIEINKTVNVVNLSRARSSDNLKRDENALDGTIKRKVEREGMQSRLKQKMKDLQTLLQKNSHGSTRLIRKNILNIM